MSIYYDDTADIETVKLDQNEETLTGTKTLVTTDKVMQKLNPGGASRDVTLPVITNDLMFIIYNSGTVATFNLVVKNPAAATLATLGPGMMGVFHCGAAWKWIDDSGFYYDAVSGNRDINGAMQIKGTLDLYGNRLSSVKDIRFQSSFNGDFYLIGADKDFRFFQSESVQVVTFKSTGNVGIGGNITNPIYLFDADGAINSRVYHKTEDFDEEANGVQLEAGLRADEYTGGGTNYASANVTYTGAVNGEVQILTTAADDDSAFIMGLPQQAIDNDPIFETRFKMTNITNGFCGVGLVEGSFVDKATYDDDICIVGIDSDNAHGFGADRLILITNDNNAGAIIDNLGVDLVADTYVKVKLDLTDTEQPRVWINDTEIAAGSITGTVQAGVTMANYAMTQALSAAADTLTVDYFKNWNSR